MLANVRNLKAKINPALVQSSHCKDSLAVQGDSLDTFVLIPSNSSETCVAADIILAHRDLNIVQVGCIRRPSLDSVDLESDGRARSSAVLGYNVAVVPSVAPIASITAVATVAWPSCRASMTSRLTVLLAFVVAALAPLPNGDLDVRAGIARSGHSHVDLAICCSVDVDRGDMVRWCGFDPDALPDTTAWPVEDVRRVQSLLSNRNDIWVAICWVVNEDEPSKISQCNTLDVLFGHTARSDHHD